jgi:hypothetical protein
VSEGEPLTGDGVTQGIVRIGETVARLIRALHEASAGWVPPPGAGPAITARLGQPG